MCYIQTIWGVVSHPVSKLGYNDPKLLRHSPKANEPIPWLNHLHSQQSCVPGELRCDPHYIILHEVKGCHFRHVLVILEGYACRIFHRGDSTSECFYQRTPTTILPVLVKRSSGRSHPPPSLSFAQLTSRRSFPESSMICNLQPNASSSSSPPLADLPFLAAPSASASPTRNEW